MHFFIFCLSVMLCAESLADPLFEDNFETTQNSKIFSMLSHLKDLIEIVPGAGVNGSNGLKVTYHSNDEGSKRLVARIDLSDTVTKASLSYDVKFLEDFQFVKGGKLHGVGPLNSITGGSPLKDSGWSSRVMFAEDGKILTYLYDHNKKGIYGEEKVGDHFKFIKNKFYAVTLYTQLNSSPTKANGKAQIYVDGKLIVNHDHILFWKGNSTTSRISKFLFSTFHGGHDSSWAPKDKSGNFIDVHAIFDNFVIEKGLKVRLSPGKT